MPDCPVSYLTALLLVLAVAWCLALSLAALWAWERLRGRTTGKGER